jgi:hypothetical protein
LGGLSYSKLAHIAKDKTPHPEPERASYLEITLLTLSLIAVVPVIGAGVVRLTRKNYWPCWIIQHCLYIITLPNEEHDGWCEKGIYPYIPGRQKELRYEMPL